MQGVTVLKIKWSEDIVEIIKKPPPTELGIEQKLIEQIKADHKRGQSLLGKISIRYTYIRVLGQYWTCYICVDTKLRSN